MEGFTENQKINANVDQCDVCKLALDPSYEGSERVPCPYYKVDDDDFHLVKCERPSCPGRKQHHCITCNALGCVGCMEKCQKCPNMQCHNCRETFGCEDCKVGAVNCPPCQGPLQPWVFHYAQDVKPIQRTLACADCIELYQANSALACMAKCTECALDMCCLGTCIEAKCYEHFCLHEEPDREFCDKHLGLPTKRVKVI